ncbi:MAG: hypothetical protein HY908_30270 [Myxococcales bacterium]|nr:hypothetical protein [Myxococcales bacterium]
MTHRGALAVVGLGMASPAGFTARDHALFVRAGLPPPPPSFFVLGDDEERIRCRGAPWLGTGLGPGARMTALVTTALEGALAPLGGARHGLPFELALCLPAPGPGASEDDLRDVEYAAATLLGPRKKRRFQGAAGAFEALTQPLDTDAWLCLAAVDSYISLEAIAHRLAHPASPWVGRGPPPSEGAAALVLGPAHRARQLGLSILGTVRGAATARGTATDENDEPVDGSAMGEAFGRLGLARVDLTFGQELVDALRRREWHLMAARHASVFYDGCADVCFEAEVGLMGAAAGAMSLAYGLATLVHDTCPRLPGAPPGRGGRSFVAWAIGREGVRGLASAAVP